MKWKKWMGIETLCMRFATLRIIEATQEFVAKVFCSLQECRVF